MKMSRLMSIAILGAALVLTPVYAQRGGGGGRSGGGGGHSSSVSSSRGGGHSSSSSMRSSSSHSSSSSRSSYSSPSSSSSSSTRSSVSTPSSSRSSYSGSSRSSYSGSSRSSVSAPSRSSGVGRSSDDGSRGGQSFSGSGSPSDSRSSVGRSAAPRSRTGSVPSQVRSRSGQASRGDAQGTVRSTDGAKDRSGRTNVTNGRPGGTPPAPHDGYARPGHPGHMPPSHRPMHPAPYFWHPHHHCMVHCHRLYWDPFVPRPYYWPGFWLYCDSYWYDYHVTDIAVVRAYAKDTYQLDLVAYAISNDYMYALVNDPDGHTYLQIYDKEDKLLAEQRVSRKYCKMEVDPENGGCWIMKKRDKDPLLFFYTEDGQLLIYEADK